MSATASSLIAFVDGGDNRLELQLRRVDPIQRADHLSVLLVRHTAIESEWCATVSATADGDRFVIAANVELDGVIEVSALEVPGGRRFVGGKDYAREFFVIRGAGCLTGDAATQAFATVRAEQDAFYHRAIGVGERRYRAVLLAEGVLLTRALRVPGMVAQPLSNSTRGLDLAEVLNAVLAQLSLRAQVDPSAWLDEYRRRRPTLVIHADNLHATGPEEAAQVAVEAAADLLALLALRRDAAPTLLAGVIESTDTDPAEHVVWMGVQPYAGNLLGGFLSGESQAGLVALYEGLAADPRARLWLSLHRDALADARWDFRFFRQFNLLEAMARAYFGENASVVDASGDPIVGANGAPATTRSARGKVYALVRWYLGVSQSAETNFCSDGSSPLWEEVGVWVGLRDAVAHDGGYRADSAKRITSAKRVEDAFAQFQRDDPDVDPAWTYLRNIQEATKSIVDAVLRNPPAPYDEARTIEGSGGH